MSERAKYRKRSWSVHSAERYDILEPACAERGCDRVAGVTFSTPFSERSFCLVHAPRRHAHYAILDRIRAL